MGRGRENEKWERGVGEEGEWGGGGGMRMGEGWYGRRAAAVGTNP